MPFYAREDNHSPFAETTLVAFIAGLPDETPVLQATASREYLAAFNSKLDAARSKNPQLKFNSPENWIASLELLRQGALPPPATADIQPHANAETLLSRTDHPFKPLSVALLQASDHPVRGSPSHLDTIALLRSYLGAPPARDPASGAADTTAAKTYCARVAALARAGDMDEYSASAEGIMCAIASALLSCDKAAPMCTTPGDTSLISNLLRFERSADAELPAGWIAFAVARLPHLSSLFPDARCSRNDITTIASAFAKCNPTLYPNLTRLTISAILLVESALRSHAETRGLATDFDTLINELSAYARQRDQAPGQDRRTLDATHLAPAWIAVQQALHSGNLDEEATFKLLLDSRLAHLRRALAEGGRRAWPHPIAQRASALSVLGPTFIGNAVHDGGLTVPDDTTGHPLPLPLYKDLLSGNIRSTVAFAQWLTSIRALPPSAVPKSEAAGLTNHVWTSVAPRCLPAVFLAAGYTDAREFFGHLGQIRDIAITRSPQFVAPCAAWIAATLNRAGNLLRNQLLDPSVEAQCSPRLMDDKARSEYSSLMDSAASAWVLAAHCALDTPKRDPGDRDDGRRKKPHAGERNPSTCGGRSPGASNPNGKEDPPDDAHGGTRKRKRPYEDRDVDLADDDALPVLTE